MSNLSDWIDGDGLVGLEKDVHDRPSSQNGVCYTGIAYALTKDHQYKNAILEFLMRQSLAQAEQPHKTGYERNSVTTDLMSFDDLFAAMAVSGIERNAFKKNRTRRQD